jgi:hypothetical protein
LGHHDAFRVWSSGHDATMTPKPRSVNSVHPDRYLPSSRIRVNECECEYVVVFVLVSRIAMHTCA